MKKFLILAMCTILSAMSVRAQQTTSGLAQSKDSCLVVWLKNGTQATYLLNKSPKITFDGESVIVESSETVKYGFKDIKKMSFIPRKKTRGDVNGDNIVNMVDVDKVVSLIMAEKYDEAADVNADKLVNASDLVEVISAKNWLSTSTADFIVENARRRKSMLASSVTESEMESLQKSIRIFLNTGETVDMDPTKIGEINLTTLQQSVLYNGTYRNFSIESVDSIWYITPVLRLTRGNYDFGKVAVGLGRTTTLTIKNTGDNPETYSFLADGVFSAEGSGKDYTIDAGQSQSIELAFLPNDTIPYEGELTISSSAAAGGKLSMAVNGVGVTDVSEEEVVILPAVEEMCEVEIPEEMDADDFEGFVIQNSYGEFPVNAPARTRGLTRNSNGNFIFNSPISVSPNGIQSHFMLNKLGQPFFFSLTLPNQQPTFSAEETAIALLMSEPLLITSNEAEFENTVNTIKRLPAFEEYVKEIRKEHNKSLGKYTPSFINISPQKVINQLAIEVFDNKELTLSGVELSDLQRDNGILKFRIKNNYKRLLHIYRSRVKMNEGNVAVDKREDISLTFSQLFKELLNTTAFSKELLDEEDKSFIDDLDKWILEIEDLVKQVGLIGEDSKICLPISMESPNSSYWKLVKDGFKSYFDDELAATSIFENYSDELDAEFGDYDKVFIDVYGMGWPNKKWNEYTVDEKLRMVLAFLEGGYKDFIKPLMDFSAGLKEANAARGFDNYNYDFRYGARKYPEKALGLKLLNDFCETMDGLKTEENVKTMGHFLEKGDVMGVIGFIAGFMWDGMISKILAEPDESNKRTYTNLIYNIYKKWSGNTATSKAFRDNFKSVANNITHLKKTNFVGKVISAAEKGLDVGGAVYAFAKSHPKETFIVDKSDQPYITVRRPDKPMTKTAYANADHNIIFEWDTYKSKNWGVFLYDIIAAIETAEDIKYTTIVKDFDGTSCTYNFDNLPDSKDALSIVFRIVAHHPENSEAIYAMSDYHQLADLTDVRKPIFKDLGLPSGTLWAASNMGSKYDAGFEYGNYYAWGEIEEKDYYTWNNYKYCNKSHDKLTKYCTKAYYSNNNKPDDLYELKGNDDPASRSYGYYYGIPSKEDWQELIDNCTWTKYANGVMAVSKNNGTSIYFPTAGYKQSYDLYDAGQDGYYWTSTLDHRSPDDAWLVHINNGKPEFYGYYRSQGRSIRPVLHKRDLSLKR